MNIAWASVAEILRHGPRVAAVFSDRRMACLGCALADLDTVEEAAVSYGLQPEVLVGELAAALSDGHEPLLGRLRMDRPSDRGGPHPTNTKEYEMDELVGRILTTTELVQYQSGSIVSRTLLDGDGGDVTLFAFATGQGLSEHTSTRHALAYVLEGRARFTVDGQSMEAGAGEAVAMPANIPHALEAEGEDGFKMLLCLVKP